MSRHPQEILSDLLDSLEASAAIKRKKALLELVECIEREPRVRASLAANSRRIEGVVEIDWVLILNAFLDAVCKEGTRKSKNIHIFWEFVHQLVDLAERESHYLRETVPALSEHLIKILRLPELHDKVGIWACKILKLLLAVPAYCAVIPSEDLCEIFAFFARQFKQLASEASQKSRQLLPLMIGQYPFLCAQILSALVINYPRDVPHFLRTVCLPFYLAYFTANPPVHNATATLLDGLNRVLEMNALSVVAALRELVGPIMEFMSKGWSKQSPVIRTRMVAFMTIALRVSNYLPVGREFAVFGQLKPSSLLYRALVGELYLDALYPSGESQTLDQEVQGRLVMDPHTLSLLAFTTDLVYMVHCQDLPSERVDKKRKLNERGQDFVKEVDAIWDYTQQLTLPRLKFLFIFLFRHPTFFENRPVVLDSLLEVLLGLVNQASTPKAIREWSLGCLAKLASVPKAAVGAERARTWTSLWDILMKKAFVEGRGSLGYQLAIEVVASLTESSLIAPDRVAQLHAFISGHLVPSKIRGDKLRESSSAIGGASPVIATDVVEWQPDTSVLRLLMVYLQKYPLRAEGIRHLGADASELSQSLICWLLNPHLAKRMFSVAKFSPREMFAQTEWFSTVLSLLSGLALPVASHTQDFWEEVCMVEGQLRSSECRAQPNMTDRDTVWSQAVLDDSDLETLESLQVYWKEAQFARLIDVGSPRSPPKGKVELTQLQLFAMEQIGLSIQQLRLQMEEARENLKDEDLKQCCRLYLHYLHLGLKILTSVSGVEGSGSEKALGMLRDSIQGCCVELAKAVSFYADGSRLDRKFACYLDCVFTTFPTLFASACPEEAGVREGLSALSKSLSLVVMESLALIYTETVSQKSRDQGFVVMEYKEDEFFSLSSSGTESSYAIPASHTTDRATNIRLTTAMVLTVVRVLHHLLQAQVGLCPEHALRLRGYLRRELDEDPQGKKVGTGMGVGLILAHTDMYFPLQHLVCCNEGVVKKGEPNIALRELLMMVKADVEREQDYTDLDHQLRVLLFMLKLSESVATGNLVVEDEAEEKVLCSHILSTLKAKPSLDRFGRLVLARCVLSGLDSKLWDLASMSLQLCKDSDFIIRLFISTQLRGLFNHYEQAEKVYLSFRDLVVKELQGDEDHILSGLAVLVQIGAFDESAECMVVFQLCDLLAHKPELRPYLLRAFQQLSVFLGYANQNKTSLALDHLDFLLMEWIALTPAKPSWHLCDFPRELLDPALAPSPSTYVPFLQRYQEYVVPALFMNADKDLSMLAEVGRHLGSSTGELTKVHYARIIARLLALYAVRTDDNNTYDRAQVILEQLKKTLGEKNFNTLYREQMDMTIIKLIDTVTLDPGYLLPRFDVSNLKVSLQHIAKTGLEQPIGVFLADPESDRMQSILMHIRQCLERTFRPQPRFKIFKVLRLLVDVLGAQVGLPGLYRPLLDLLLKLLPTFVLQYPWDPLGCVSLLSAVVKRALQAPSEESKSRRGSTEVARYLRDLVAGLLNFESAKDVISGTEDVQKHQLAKGTAVVKIFKLVLEQLPRADLPAVTMLDPFPSGALYKGFNKFYDELCGQRTLAYDIERFLGGADKTMRSHLHIRPLRLLLAQLTLYQDQLNTLLKGDVLLQSPFSRGLKFRGPELVMKLLGVLVALCRAPVEEADEPQAAAEAEQLQTLAAACIGAIGVTSRSLMLSHHSQLFVPRLAGTVGSSVPSLPTTSGLTNPELELDIGYFAHKFHHTFVLRLLCHFLRDPEVEVIELTVDALRAIFRLGGERGMDVSRAFEALDEVQQGILKPFLLAERARQSKSGDVKTNLDEEAVKARCHDWWYDGPSQGLWDPSDKTARMWLCQLTRHLISKKTQDHFLASCGPLAAKRYEFASRIFPLVLYDILQNDDPLEGIDARILADSVNRLMSEEATLVPGEKHVHRSHVTTVLAALQFIHEQQMVVKRQPVRNESRKKNSPMIATMEHISAYFVNDVNMLQLALQAQHCRMYFSSLFFLEEWHCRVFGGLSKDRQREAKAPSDTDMESFHRLLLAVYRNVDEPDGIYGVLALCEKDSLESQNIDLVLAEHQGSWSRTLQVYDSLLSMAQKDVSSEARAGLTRSLHNLGCYHVLQSYMPAAHNSLQYMPNPEMQMEAAWRTCSWDLPLSGNTNRKASIHFNVFQAFRNLSFLVQGRDQQQGFASALLGGRLVVAQQLSALGAENGNALLPSIADLQLLHDAETFSQLLSSDDRVSSVKDFMQALWARLSLLDTSNLDLVEPIMAARSVLLKLSSEFELLGRHLQRLLSFARGSSCTSAVAAATNAMRQSCSGNLSPLHQLSLKLEDAQIAWQEGLVDSAIRSAKQVVQMGTQMSTVRLSRSQPAETTSDELIQIRVDSCCLLAEWQSTSRSEGVATIREHLESAIEKASQLAPPLSATAAHKAHYQFGRLMDRTAQGLLSRQESLEFEAAREAQESQGKEVARLHEELIQLNKDESKSKHVRDLMVHYQRLKLEYDLDLEEHKKFTENVYTSLQQAVEQYCECLILGDDYDNEVLYRLVSLWFTHHSKMGRDKESKSRLSHLVGKVPSRKFVLLVYQIASRLDLPDLDESEKFFRCMVRDLIKRMAMDHPHHTLFQVFALANGTKLNHTSRNAVNFTPYAARIQAAESLLTELKSTQHCDLIVAMDQVINAYVSLADLNEPRSAAEDGDDQRPLAIASTDLGKLSTQTMEQVSVATASLTIRNDCDYTDVPRMSEFSPSIDIATSGVNRPFILRVRATDGVWYKQLVKSADDLRQDAVMEQVFKLVNMALRSMPGYSRRCLQIRTYNVVPLTPCVGLVEWVNQTSSLFDVLVSRSHGVHTRYRAPQQTKTFMQWFKFMKEGHAKDKRGAFDRYVTVCDDFQPAFRHFFLESYPSPFEWFTKRLAYMRSVAVNSIVGYIVGLGDRHNNNILLDKASAEVVHIDLGVAFDMGKVLKTPEIVPFRLTRDTVDGFGVTGCDGVFRRCCEETMRVLRLKQEMLLTVLEVFLHDPLYKWSLSPEKLQQMRGEDEGTVSANAGAHRALYHVKQRLRGEEYGEALSVEGQVKLLVSEATDPRLLCKMYYGWAAFV